MASITQTIPNYTSGMSEQPDQLKNPGQVSDVINATPEVQTGLVKRPGSRFIKDIGESRHRFFHYYRDQDEQYIGQVMKEEPNSNTAPVVKLWNLREFTGPNGVVPEGTEFVATPDSANATYINQYLKYTDENDLQFLTINDYTYILNRNPRTTNNQVIPCSMTVDKAAGWGNTEKDADGNDVQIGHKNFAYIELKKTANARQYSLNLNKTTNTTKYSITSATRLVHKRVYPDHTVLSATLDGNDALQNWTGGTHTDAPIKATNGVVTNTTGKPFHSRNIQQDGKYNGRTEGSCVDIDTDVFSSDQSVCTIYDKNNNEITDGSRKNLIFRFTVKGRSATHEDAGSSLNGEDYVCKYDYDVELLHGGEGWEQGDYIKFVMIARSAPDQSVPADSGSFKDWISPTYFVKVKEIEKSDVLATIGSTAGDGAIRPDPTPFDADMAVSATTILGGLQQGILDPNDDGNEADKLVSGAEIIGNGLYIYNTSDTDTFNVTTGEADLMNIVTSEVNDVTKLPTQCKNGVVVKVVNSELEEDDYYMRFYGNDGQDGPGGWRECTKPGIRYKIDATTMPMQLIRQKDLTFTIQLTNWPSREVGDNVTNPKASFLSRGQSIEEAIDGTGDLKPRSISNMVFWRNRVVMLSGTNVICSRPGANNLIEPNFWANTALTISPQDVIDLSTSTSSPAKLFEGIEIGQGLLVFSENKQWLLAAEAEVLGPETAKLTPATTYNFNTSTKPVSLGTTLGFLDNAGKRSKFFEATRIQRGYEPEVLDQSISVPDLLPQDINLITNSRENTYVFFAVRGTDTLYGYRYFNSGEKRIQSAWFKWTLDKNIQYIAIIDDLLFVVHENNNLVKYPLVDKWSNWVDNFPIHLDNWSILESSDLTYDSSTNKTTFEIGQRGFEENRDLYVFDAHLDNDGNPTNDYGRYGIATVSSSTATLPGDWKTSGNSLFVGYNFEMQIKLPTIYPTAKEASDVNASLVVHRVKLSLGAAGVYETSIERIGKPTYTELIESSLQDAYVANKSPWVDQRIHTLPTYERNKNLTVYLKSTHPSPTTLFSMSWEGDYSDKFYQRV